MPPGVPFHNPLLYNQQQLQQILANLEKIAFLKLSHDSSSQLLEVEISADTVAASLVGGHTHHLHLSTEEDPAQ
ncbi:hypothetical protein GBAR_LOCUS6980 [Geodia barretti]|uniref:Uncharacterized protein n=1 Tax=Geodia barretti TaxID=519541 RepID=A0AA35RIA6_GEOBA|nr:hypothetical protein GBAR_LOCUS6980 [Geodia barretti]